MIVLKDLILLHLQDGRRIPVDPQEIYLLEAEGGETLVRTRHAQPLTDVRQLSKLLGAFEPHGFVQVHVNRVLPVSRRRVSALWERFGE
jgi:DNA-binding LytR/AlgR family response regulator